MLEDGLPSRRVHRTLAWWISWAGTSNRLPVFTYLLEDRDTGETNYIPGIALK